MTEAEWLACVHPSALLAHLRGSTPLARTKAGRRKLRLFACACCRRIWEALTDDRSRAAVEAAEAFADDLLSRADLGLVREAAEEATRSTPRGEANAANAACFVASEASATLLLARVPASFVAARLRPGTTREDEWAGQAAVLRDLFGNPFRTVGISPAWLAWRDGSVTKVARTIYGERAFEQLPVLADALEDAGCDNGEILAHLRGGGHVRGCWVLDLILGKR
jgi:hypothetical protein